MDPAEPIDCREAAARCRKTAMSSTSPKEWILMAEKWEWLANTSEGSYQSPSRSRDKGERSQGHAAVEDRCLG